MKFGRVLLSLSLVLSGVLCLSSFQSIPANPTPSVVVSGKMAGTWNKPTPNKIGKAAGVLADNGSPKFLVQLRVKREPGGSAPNGEIRGTLTLPGTGIGPFNPVVFAQVVGKWVDVPGQPGRFRGALIRPNPAMGGQPMVIGSIRGTFVDPPSGQAGKFKGKWAITK